MWGSGGKEFRIPCFGKPEPLCLKDFGTERDGSVFSMKAVSRLPVLQCDFSEMLLSVTSNY